VRGRTAQDDNRKERSDGQYESEEYTSITSEDQHPYKQNKSAAPYNENVEEDDSYEDSAMFSEDNYKGFAFLQDVTPKMNDKVGIPDSWILLDSQSTVDMLMNKTLLKNIHDAKTLFLYIAMLE